MLGVMVSPVASSPSGGYDENAGRIKHYINTLGAGSFPDETGTSVAWAVGSDANDGLSPATPWLSLNPIGSVGTGQRVVYIRASATSGSGQEVTSTATVPIFADRDIVFVPLVSNAIIKPGGTGLSRLFAVDGDNAFFRLRRGPAGQVFRIDCAAIGTTACRGAIQINPAIGGTYGVEISGAHSWFDSAGSTVVRTILSFMEQVTYRIVTPVPAGTPTFIFTNGCKVVGESEYIRGIVIHHLGAGTLRADSIDFSGTAQFSVSGGGVEYRTLEKRALLSVVTANGGNLVQVTNTYGEFIATGASLGAVGVKIMDCQATVMNTYHKLRAQGNAAYFPLIVGGFNQSNVAQVENVYCEITSGTATTPAGIVALIGSDGFEQPRLALTTGAVGPAVVYAEWDFFQVGVDETKVITGGGGTFRIDTILSARHADVTVLTTVGTTLMNSFTPANWRIGNKTIGGFMRTGLVKGMDHTASTTHGPFIGGCANVQMTGVESQYCAPALAIKNAVNCEMRNNVGRYIPNAAHAIVAKGAVDSTWADNEVYLQSSGYIGGGVRVDSDDYGLPSTGCIIEDNDIYIQNSSYTSNLFRVDAPSEDVIMRRNRWIMQDGGSVPARFRWDTVTDHSFATYQSWPFTTDEVSVP